MEPRVFETDSASPDLKKQKFSDSPFRSHTTRDNSTGAAEAEVKGQSGIKMAAPIAKKNLNFSEPEQTTSAPEWFREFDKRLDEKLSSLFSQISVCHSKLKVHEDMLIGVDYEFSQMKSEMEELRKENESLADKIDDIENRGRRKNLVIFGIGEKHDSQAGNGMMKEDGMKTVCEFFKFVGVQQSDLECIERAHRTPTFLPRPRDKTNKKQKPRMFHVAFTTYVVKERVRKLCLEKLKQSKGAYSDSSPKVFVAEDLSKRVLQQRKVRLPQFFALKEKGAKPFFSYPARVCYRDQKSGKVIIVEPDAEVSNKGQNKVPMKQSAPPT